jgi:hypothetical protein
MVRLSLDDFVEQITMHTRNVDNLACVALTRQKEYLGYPMSLLLEGHAYWVRRNSY